MIARAASSHRRLGQTGRGAARLAVALSACLLLAEGAAAQGWQWPWENEPKPVPREPVYQPPPGQSEPGRAPDGRPLPWQRPQSEPGPPPGVQGPPAPGAAPQAPTAWAPKPSICLQLEQRLVLEGQRGNQSRDLLPMLESEQRSLAQQLRAAEDDLERGNCYEYFLFSKSLRRTRRCIDAAQGADQLKRHLADLTVQRQQLVASDGESYSDDIVRELSRNGCGASYEQQARRLDQRSNPFSSLWEGEGAAGGGGLGTYNAQPYATYRTLCVRLCDGYYFPISFSTLPNHFERDAEACQSKCAAPVELFYHQNPGGGVEQMVDAKTNTPYTTLKSAFRYRKEYVAGCSCKTEEFVPQTPIPQQQTGTPGSTTTAAGTAASGWSADTQPTQPQ